MSNPEYFCTFCGERQREFIVAGPMVFICDQCVELAQDIIDAAKREKIKKREKLAFINPVVSWTNEARQARYVEGRIIYRESIKHLFKETKNAE